MDTLTTQYKDRVFFVSKEGCKYCALLEKDLEELGLDPKKLLLGKDVSQNVVDDIKSKTTQKTFPMLFFGTEFIGGYDSFQQLCYVGELQSKLKDTLGIQVELF